MSYRCRLFVEHMDAGALRPAPLPVNSHHFNLLSVTKPSIAAGKHVQSVARQSGSWRRPAPISSNLQISAPLATTRKQDAARLLVARHDYAAKNPARV
jgi:hypothetical protein